MYNKFKGMVVDNLVWAYRRCGAFGEDSMWWYWGANKLAQEMSGKYNLSIEQSAGMLAVESPQNPWDQNIYHAKTIADILTNQQNTVFDDKMAAEYLRYMAIHEKDYIAIKNLAKAKINLSLIQGVALRDIPEKLQSHFIRTYDQVYGSTRIPTYTPDGELTGDISRRDDGEAWKQSWNSFSMIDNAISIFKDGSKENITRQLGSGHKVRSFYNNIVNPGSKSGNVTIDTHAVAISLFSPVGGSSFEVSANFGTGGYGTSTNIFIGISGTYAAFADAYRIAAAEVGILPNQFQSVVWNGAQGLFPRKLKLDKVFQADISKIWDKFDGTNLEEIRDEVYERSGGIRNPVWNGGTYYTGTKRAGVAGNKGKLSGTTLLAERIAGPDTGRDAGIPTGGSEARLRVVDTPAFKKWFGESVVTENGKPGSNPMVVYHGTTDDFNAFKNSNWSYFAANPEYATAFATVEDLARNQYTIQQGAGTVMPVYLSIQNLLDFSEFHLSEITPDDFNMFLKGKGIDFNIKSKFKDKVWAILRRYNDEIQEAASIAGYDGITMDEDVYILPDEPVLKEGKITTKAYIAFSPNQIKSATGNTGAFDATNPDIRMKNTKTPIKKDVHGLTMAEFNDQFPEWSAPMKVVIHSNWDKIAMRLSDGEVAIKILEDHLKTLGVQLGYKESLWHELNRVAGQIRFRMEQFYDQIEEPYTKMLINMEADTKTATLPGVNYRQTDDYLSSKSSYYRNIRKNAEARQGLTDIISQARKGGFNDLADKYQKQLDTYTDKVTGGIPGSMTAEWGPIINAARLARGESELSAEEINAEIPYQDVMDYLDKTVQDFERRVGTYWVNELWRHHKRLTNFTLDSWLDAGEISQDTYNFYTNDLANYYYSPLRGWKGETAEDIFEYINGNLGGGFSGNKGAMGRLSEADDTIPMALNMAYSSIVWGQQNKAKRLLYDIILNEGDKVKDHLRLKNYWEIKVGNDWVEVNEKPDQQMWIDKKARVKKFTGLSQRNNPQNVQQHIVHVKIAGETKDIYLGDPRVAVAINGDPTRTKGALDLIGKGTREMAALMTSKNPVFITSNTPKDFKFAARGIWIEEGSEAMLQFNTNWALGNRAVIRYVGKKAASPMSKVEIDAAEAQLPWIFAKLRSNGYKSLSVKEQDILMWKYASGGGMTGYVKSEGFDVIKDRMIRRAKWLNRAAKTNIGGFNYNPAIWIYQAFKLESEYIGMLGDWSETISRFATYVTYIQRGSGVEEAITRGKDSTTNFDRRGGGPNDLNAANANKLYNFFSARVGGVRRFYELFKGSPLKVGAFFAFDVAAGILLKMLLWNWFKPEDDKDKEGIRLYQKINKYVRQGYSVFPIPWEIGGEDMILSVPNAHSWNIGHGMGSIFFDLWMNEATPKQAISDMTKMIINNMAPMDVGGWIGSDAKLKFVTPLIPTVAMPLWETLVTNTTFSGQQVSKVPYTQGLAEITSESQLYKKNVNPTLKRLTNLLFTSTGGDLKTGWNYNWKDGKEIHPWGINPSKVEHIIEGYTAGRGQWYNQIYKLVARSWTPEEDKVPLQSYDIPGINRLVRTGWTDVVQNDWYDQKKEAQQRMTTFKKKVSVGVAPRQAMVDIGGKTVYDKVLDIIGLNKQIDDINETLASPKVSQIVKDREMARKRKLMIRVNAIELK